MSIKNTKNKLQFIHCSNYVITISKFQISNFLIKFEIAQFLILLFNKSGRTLVT